MNQFNNNRYQNKRHRAYWWNYGWNGSYYITICAHKRQKFFGQIIRKPDERDNLIQVMELSETGKKIQERWMDIPEHFPFVSLGEFVVMPDHLHGILSFNKGEEFNKPLYRERQTEIFYGYNNWKSGILGNVVNQFKRICTIQSRVYEPEFKWQRGYYDRIIRNQLEFNIFTDYIAQNPSRYKMEEKEIGSI
ncbi:MAG TPA: hypothetical protein DIW47_13065 [Bacteroidetes bacterium]|nr:hypothetical protein [Bacteroidota bacterium]